MTGQPRSTVLEPATAIRWEGHHRDSAEYRRILVALLCAGVATFAQLYSPQPVLPLISRGLTVPPADAALTVSAATMGLALGVLPWSWAADRYGRLPMMKVALVAAAAAGLVVPLLPTFHLILAARVVEGLALGGVPGVALTYLTEEVHRPHVAGAAGTYIAGTSLGGLAGRLIAAPVAGLAGWRVGVLTVAALSTVATLVFALLVPAARGYQRHPDARAAIVLRATAANLRRPAMLVLYGQGFLLMGGFVAVYNYLTFRLEHAPFNLAPAVTSLLFLAYLSGTVSARYTGPLIGRLGRHRVLIASIVVMIAGLAITLGNKLWLIVPGLVVFTAGFFGAHATASGWSSARATTGRAQSSSLYNLFYYVGSSLIGWLGGLAYTAGGWAAVVLLVGALALVSAAWAAIDALADRRVARP